MNLDITIIDKLRGLLNIISLKRKIFLFMVIKREGVDTWDLVFGGDKIDNKINLDLITTNINRIFEEKEIVLFSRLILLNSGHPFLESINRAFLINGGSLKIENTRINDIFVKDAYLIYSESIGDNKVKVEDDLKKEDIVEAKDAVTNTTNLENKSINDIY